MSQQAQRWNKPKAGKKHYQKQLNAQANKRQKKIEAMAKDIVVALEDKSNQGVLYAYTYDVLLLTVAREIGFGPGAKSQHQLSEDRRAFLAGVKDRHTSRKQQRHESDNRGLMHDAVVFAQRQKWIIRYDEKDGMVALHLPGKQPPRWTVFFASVRLTADDYIPSEEELCVDAHTLDHHGDSESYVPTGHVLAKLRGWGELPGL